MFFYCLSDTICRLNPEGQKHTGLHLYFNDDRTENHQSIRHCFAYTSGMDLHWHNSYVCIWQEKGISAGYKKELFMSSPFPHDFVGIQNM